MQAIVTKFFGPTNSRGSRIKATCEAGSVTVPYDHSESGVYGAHDVAALALLSRLGWQGEWTRGSLPKGCVYVMTHNYPHCEASIRD